MNNFLSFLGQIPQDISAIISNAIGSKASGPQSTQSIQTPDQSPVNDLLKQQEQAAIQRLQNPQPTRSTTSSATPDPNSQIIQQRVANNQGGNIWDTSQYKGNSTQSVPQPPKQIGDLFNQYFNGDQARALATTYFENRGFKSDAMNYNFNDHTSSTDPRLAAQHGGIASTDYGLMQINDKGAFKDLQNMAPNFLKAHGINSPRDLLDPEKNVAAAYAYTTLLRNQGVANPWERWYGWQDNGYNLNQ